MRPLRYALFAATLMAAAPAIAQDAPKLTIELEDGPVVIQLRPDLAPKHVEQVVSLAKDGAYDGVAFHRVIDGFMAQTGDVEHGKPGGNAQLAGTGGSSLPDIPAEFTTSAKFQRGTVGMARSQDPNSANSQFFIMFEPAPFLDGQYTILGEVIEGMEHVDAIKRGDGPNGAVLGEPDRMVDVTVDG